MRALVCHEYGPPENLRIEDWEDPLPGDREVVFDVHAAGLNFADILIVGGRYQVRTPTPFVPGNEASGIVTAIGSHVTRFKVGDRVIGALRGGAFAEQSVIDERFAFPLPRDLSYEQGAAYPIAYGTSYHAMKQGARLRSGETVLVLGAAGGVGSTAVEIAKAMGARVIAAASSGEKLAFARDSGADEGIDYSTAGLKDAVRDLTDGRGVDVVYDPVGGALAVQALRTLAWHGRYVVVGFASGEIPNFPANLALLKEASIVGTWWGTWAATDTEEMLCNMQELEAMVVAGQLRPRCPQVFGFEDFGDAFDVIRSRRALGKIVLKLR